MAEGDFRSGFAALVGRPNVGKSTLFNALLGERISIVSRRKQTTRNRIRGVLNMEGHQVVLVDTPGWEADRGGAMSRIVRAAAEGAPPEADVAAVVVDAQAGHPDDGAIMSLCPESKPAICVVNKIDRLANRNAALSRIEELAAARDFEAIVPISALKGEGLEVLVDVLRGLMPKSPPLFDVARKHNLGERFVVEEFVREKLYRYLDEELPYAVAAELTRSEHTGKLLKLHVTVHVDQENRKRILVGKGGEMAKKIGRAARLDLQRLLGVKIFLELRVKVTRNWSRRKSLVSEMGIGDIR